jgi:acyl carrier protein
MNSATTAKEIFSVIEQVVGIDPFTLDLNADFRTQVSLDSMAFVSVIAKLESHYNIDIPLSVMDAVTLNEFVDKLRGVLAESKI